MGKFSQKEINELERFSREHYTYINQIFGDQTVRKYIKKFFPNPQYKFKIEKTDEFGHHHLLRDVKHNIYQCSVKNGYQDISKNVNDTLCQSYSLLTYLGIEINPDQKQRQMDMIKMYRKILNNNNFIDKLDNDILQNFENYFLWRDYTSNSDHEYVEMNINNIFRKVNEVLDKWEEFGYLYFIGNPLKGGRKPKSRKNVR
jgi:hypothetical protein